MGRVTQRTSGTATKTKAPPKKAEADSIKQMKKSIELVKSQEAAAMTSPL